jgi:PAS domain-containing protein
VAGALLLLFLMIGLLPSSDFGIGRYLPLHTAMETGAIVVAMLVFGIVWNAYSDERPGNVVLGVVLLGTALLDFGHMLGYRGMPDFVTPASPQKAIVFWLAARLLVAAGLLVAALRPWQPMLETRHRYRLLVGVLAYVALLALELLTPDHLPAFFVPGSGLTPLKVALEYGLVLIYGAAALVFAWRAAHGGLQCGGSLRRVGGGDALRAVLHPLRVGERQLQLHRPPVQDHLLRLHLPGGVRRERAPAFQALSRALDNEKHWAAEQHSLVRTLDMLEEAVIELRPDGTIINANSGWWQLAGRAPGTYPLLDSVRRKIRPPSRAASTTSPTAPRTSSTGASASWATPPTNAGWSAALSPS